MDFTGLKNKYVSVLYDGVPSYGGAQNKSDSAVIRKCGCGLIAAADMFLYLEGKCQSIEQTEYDSFCRSLLPGYFQLIPPLGMNAITLCAGVNLYFRIHSMPYYALWGAGRKKFYRVITDMLAEDMPVILSIGPNFPLFWQKNKLTFYRKTADGLYVGASSAKAHFITVTGIDGIWMRVSSWGKQYYVNRNEFFRYIDDHSNNIFSNILVIKEISK